MARIERQALLKRFHAMIRKGQPIVGDANQAVISPDGNRSPT